jgi:hypothetical protein
VGSATENFLTPFLWQAMNLKSRICPTLYGLRFALYGNAYFSRGEAAVTDRYI